MSFLNVIQYRKIYLSIAASFVILSWIAILVFGLKPGIDLSGGTEWQVTFQNSNVSSQQVENTLALNGLNEFAVLNFGGGTFLIRSNQINATNHQKYFNTLKDKLGDLREDNFSNIGPAVSKELAHKAFIAILLVLLGISLYIAYAFRKVSRPVSSWKYGIATLVSLVHDVSVTTGFLAILGKWRGVLIDTNSIVALLVVMGFSVHDTIVVFDRIRENLYKRRGKQINLKEVIEYSVKETFRRSVNTSFTLILVLVALLIFGPFSLFYFVLTMLVGTFFGTYSSIFIASPLLYLKYKEQ
jgi:preprotein translocase subunit SecF